MSVIKPILHDRRANCWLLPLFYRKGYPQKQFTVNIMVNPSTHIMRCNKLIFFVGSYIHPQKKRFIERGNMVARLWMKVRSMNETVAKVNHTKQYTPHTNRGFHFLYSALRLYELILKFGSFNWQMIGKIDL